MFRAFMLMILGKWTPSNLLLSQRLIGGLRTITSATRARVISVLASGGGSRDVDLIPVIRADSSGRIAALAWGRSLDLDRLAHHRRKLGLPAAC